MQVEVKLKMWLTLTLLMRIITRSLRFARAEHRQRR